MIAARTHRFVADKELANDLAQETFIRAWKARATIPNERALVAWTCRTSSRLAIDALRKRKRRRNQPATARAVEAVGHRRLELESIINALEPDAAQLLVLERIEGMTQAEIAESLHISERTVRRRSAALVSTLTRLGGAA